MRKKSRFLSGWNLVLLIVCVVLSLVLLSFLVWNHQAERKETERLKKEAAAEGIFPVSFEEERPETELGESREDEESEDIQGESPEEEALAQAKGIACWGDEFFRGEEAQENSYRVALEEKLTENGYDLEVVGKTLSGASTLSMMKMAGVPEEEIEAYISEHQEGAGGAELPVTEVGTRDLTQEQMTRTEAEYIPVLFMGYYGGWNKDPQELIEQQTKILETFVGNQEQFVIVGVRPMDGSVGQEEFDRAMEAAWGEHYLSAASVTTQNVATRTGQQEIGEAIYEKLVELAYIQKESI